MLKSGYDIWTDIDSDTDVITYRYTRITEQEDKKAGR